MPARTVMADSWKLLPAGLVYMIAMVVGAPLLSFLAPPEMLRMGAAEGVSRLAWQLPIGVLVAAALAALGARIDARPLARWAILAGFLYIVHAAGSAIEARAFTTMGGSSFLLALLVAPTLLVSGAVTRLLPAKAGGRPLLASLRAFLATRAVFA